MTASVQRLLLGKTASPHLAGSLIQSGEAAGRSIGEKQGSLEISML
jgi:hypothetical protein